jgi:uncharacterized protein with PIN domain
MAQATLRFYEELNDYLAVPNRRRDIRVDFDPPCPVRHLVERFGVPHTEIELILIDGTSGGLETPVEDGDRIAVYPMFEAFDVTPLLRLRPAPLRRPRFFADAQLGRLARYLRLLGFDTLYENDVDDAELVRRANAGHRIVLSRDRRLLMRREVSHGCHIRQDRPLDQLAQVIIRCDLVGTIHPFTRCMDCNGLLHRVAKEAVEDRLEPGTRMHYEQFWQCAGCGKLYWKGSHYLRLKQLVDAAVGRPDQAKN